MSRPRKQGCSYFSHDADNGNSKTLFILEQRWGNDGYAFWFKLLESLTATGGHFLDLNNPVTAEFLQAKTRTDEATTIDILDLLAKLGSISAEHWAGKVIWCPNLIERLNSVYRNRRIEPPSPPEVITSRMSRSSEVSTCRNPSAPGVSGPESTQSKVKESKEKKKDLCAHSQSNAQLLPEAPEKPTRKKKRPEIPERYPEAFETFWQTYPARNGKRIGKGDAFLKWSVLSPEDHALLQVATENFAAHIAALPERDRVGIKDPERFILNGKGSEPWRDPAWLEGETCAEPDPYAAFRDQERKIETRTEEL